MDLQLQGKHALVTGASRGIGKAIARQLAREGCSVAICARSEGPLRDAAVELANETGARLIPVAMDTTVSESVAVGVRVAAEALGGLEIVVNSAARVGGTIPDDFDSISYDQIVRDFDEKAVGYFRCVREASPFMKQAGWGRVVNIAGLSGRAPGRGISTGARNAGVVLIAKAMANELGPYGINVNTVYPGTTITEDVLARASADAERQGSTLEAWLARQAEQSLIRHVVTAEEIANVVAFLCSPLSIGITGEAISVGGGAGADVHY